MNSLIEKNIKFKQFIQNNKYEIKKAEKKNVMKEKKNKYNEKIPNIITEPKIISKEYKSKKNDILLTSVIILFFS